MIQTSSKQVIPLVDETPKSRRRIRKLGCESVGEAQQLADQNERKEAQWQRETLNSGDPVVRAQRREKGYRVS